MKLTKTANFSVRLGLISELCPWKRVHPLAKAQVDQKVSLYLMITVQKHAKIF
jgi:hypothetical protein